MTLYLSKTRRRIVLQAGAYSGDGIGDLVIWLRPGETALGRTYEEWRALPEGPVEWEPAGIRPLDTGLLRMLEVIAAGEISGDDIVVHEEDGKLYETFPDGRRRLLPDPD